MQVIGLFSQEKNDGMRENGIKLYQERVRQNIRKSFFTETLVKYSNRLPKEVVESPFLEALRRLVDVATGNRI